MAKILEIPLHKKIRKQRLLDRIKRFFSLYTTSTKQLFDELNRRDITTMLNLKLGYERTWTSHIICLFYDNHQANEMKRLSKINTSLIVDELHSRIPVLDIHPIADLTSPLPLPSKTPPPHHKKIPTRIVSPRKMKIVKSILAENISLPIPKAADIIRAKTKLRLSDSYLYKLRAQLKHERT